MKPDAKSHCHTRVLIALLAIVMTAGCTTSSYQLMDVQDADYLYFGTAKPDGVVTDAEWKAFVDDTIAPRFREFTEWTAEGHWQKQREVTHIVFFVHPHGSGVEKDISEIITAYKGRFQQQSVYWVRQPAVAQAR